MSLFKQRYTATDGTSKESQNWYFGFTDHNEIRRRMPGFRDKSLTQELEHRVRRLVELRANGHPLPLEMSRWIETMPKSTRERLAKWDLLDLRSVAHSKPLTEHLKDFHASLLHKGTTSDHADLVRARVKNILDGCKFKFYSDISASRVQRHLADKRNGAENISAQTSNFYLQSFKQFCRWMVRDRRATESPVEHLRGVNVKTDRRHDRRALTADELTDLLKTTASGPVRHRMDGRSRAMLYRVAMETGLRRNELRSLRPASVEFDTETPCVVVEPKNAKNRKPTVQAIRPELATELQRWIQDAQIASESPLWPNLTRNTAEMLKKDLKACKIPYVDDAGLFADFHSLRHSYISLITRGGVHPKIAQRLARHSTAELTLARYSHTLLTDESQALEVLPALPSVFHDGDNRREALQATGTDNPTPKNLQQNLHRRDAEPCVSVQHPALWRGQEQHPDRHCPDIKKACKTREKPVFAGSLKAEREGFEPSVPKKGTPVFETGPFGHSGTSPNACPSPALFCVRLTARLADFNCRRQVDFRSFCVNGRMSKAEV